MIVRAFSGDRAENHTLVRCSKRNWTTLERRFCRGGYGLRSGFAPATAPSRSTSWVVGTVTTSDVRSGAGRGIERAEGGPDFDAIGGCRGCSGDDIWLICYLKLISIGSS